MYHSFIAKCVGGKYFARCVFETVTIFGTSNVRSRPFLVRS